MPNKLNILSKYYLIFFIIICFVFFYKSLSTFFVQDDFWLLNISKISSIQQFLNFFVPRADTVWYRPLSQQIFFFLGRLFFGLYPTPYHMVIFLSHIISGYILYLITLKISNHKPISLFAAFFYTINQIHVVSLSWLAADSFILGPMFLALTIWCQINKKGKLSLIFFLLGLLSNEILVIYPVILFGIQLLILKQIKWKQIFVVTTFTVLIFFLRFILFPSSQKTSQYALFFSWEIFATMKFYIYRLWGIPLFMNSLNNITKFIVYISLVGFSVPVLINIVRLIQKKKISNKIILFLIISIVGLLPFLLMPNHTAPYYMSFCLLGLAPLTSFLIFETIKGKFSYLLGIIVITSYCLLQIIGIWSTYETHWVFQRAILAKKLILEKQFIQPVGSEAYFSLGAGNAESVYK